MRSISERLIWTQMSSSPPVEISLAQTRLTASQRTALQFPTGLDFVNGGNSLVWASLGFCDILDWQVHLLPALYSRNYLQSCKGCRWLTETPFQFSSSAVSHGRAWTSPGTWLHHGLWNFVYLRCLWTQPGTLKGAFTAFANQRFFLLQRKTHRAEIRSKCWVLASHLQR